MSDSRQDRLAAELAARVEGCPDADDLQRLHEQSLRADQQPILWAHVEICAPCRQALEFLSKAVSPDEETPVDLPAELERRTEASVRAVVSGNTSSSAGWAMLLRVAAGIFLLAALAIGGYQVLGPDGAGSDLGELRGDQPLDLIAPTGKLDAPPSEMRWVAHPHAASYRVILLDEDLREVWVHRTSGAAATLALEGPKLQALAAGGRFTWQVEALDAVGATIESSGAAHLEVSPR